MNVNHKDGESEKGRGGEAVTVAVDAKKDGRPLQTRIGAESDAADGLQASQSHIAGALHLIFPRLASVRSPVRLPSCSAP